jgi:hypothetical protein
MKSDFVYPIRLIDVQEGAPLPEQYSLARNNYLSNDKSVYGFLLFRYPAKSIKYIVEYEDGWLVAADKGEWGGILYYLGRDGEVDVLIKNSDNPRDLVLWDETVLVTWPPFLPLTNAHSDVLRVRNTKEGFNVEKFNVAGANATFEDQVDGLVVKTTTPRTAEESYYSIQGVFSNAQPEQVLPPKID